MGFNPEFHANSGDVVAHGSPNPYGYVWGGATELRFGVRDALRLGKEMPPGAGARARLLGVCAVAAAQRLRNGMIPRRSRLIEPEPTPARVR